MKAKDWSKINRPLDTRQYDYAHRFRKTPFEIAAHFKRVDKISQGQVNARNFRRAKARLDA